MQTFVDLPEELKQTGILDLDLHYDLKGRPNQAIITKNGSVTTEQYIVACEWWDSLSSSERIRITSRFLKKKRESQASTLVTALVSLRS